MNETATPPAPIFSPETTKAELTLALSKEGLIYQNLLQQGELVKFTKDNLAEVPTPLTSLRKVKKQFGEMKNPYTESWQGWNEAKKSLVDPVDELIKKKEGEYRKVHAEVEAENKKIADEKQRVDTIALAIDTFFLDQSQVIAAATTTQQLVSIEKLIGSHNGNKSKYQEFLPDLIKKSEELTPLIKKQKQHIKDLEESKQKEFDALKSGNDQAVLDAREAQEAITQKIDEGKIVAQETAINMAAAPTQGSYSGSSYQIPTATKKARRSSWKAEIINKEVAMKKSSHLLRVELDPEKISDSIKTLKEAGVLKDENSPYEVNGIKYYLDKSFI